MKDKIAAIHIHVSFLKESGLLQRNTRLLKRLRKLSTGFLRSMKVDKLVHT